MCGRATLTIPSLAAVAAIVDAAFDPADAALYRPRFNLAPTDPHWLLTTDHRQRRIVSAFWGLERRPIGQPSQTQRGTAPGRRDEEAGWNQPRSNARGAVRSKSGDHAQLVGAPSGKQKPLVINARAETAPQRFRSAFQERRCLVPLDGFYEWTGMKKNRHPIWYHAPDNGLLLLAGLFERRATDEIVFTILTTTANGLIAPVHDRMPVIIPPDKVDEWLATPATGLLVPAPETALVALPVSSRANSVAHDDPECLAPLADDERKGQLQLL